MPCVSSLWSQHKECWSRRILRSRVRDWPRKTQHSLLPIKNNKRQKIKKQSWAWHVFTSAAPTLKLPCYTEHRPCRSVNITGTGVLLFVFYFFVVTAFWKLYKDILEVQKNKNRKLAGPRGVYTCNPIYMKGIGMKICWTQKARVAKRKDHTVAL